MDLHGEHPNVKTLVIGTAGHIDHGKSALVQALTGTDPDRLKEEKARGITIELGFAHATIGDVEVAFVDVPGHEKFVRTMLAGAGGLDAVLLVVAADESVMPQTREHFEICRLLGMSRGLIVITKADAADADTIELAELEARELVAGSALEAAPVIAVSAHTGQGLDRLREAIAGLVAEAPPVAERGITRLPIDRAFSIRGFGSVVTGTLVSGALHDEDALAVLPGGQPVRVRGLQVHGRTTASVAAPQRVAVNLGGVTLAEVTRGMTLATPGTLAVTRRVDVRLELLPGARPLRHGARVRVHQGTGDWLGRVSIASVRARPADAWTPVPPGASDVEVPPSGQALARLRLASPAVLTRGDRLVLRAASPVMTIGGAVVLDPEPAAGGVRRKGAAARLAALTADDSIAWVTTWLSDAALRGLTAGDLVRRGGLSPGKADAILRRLVTDGNAIHSTDRHVDAAAATAARAAIVAQLAAFHRDHPGEVGVPREVVRAHVAAGDVFETLLSGLGAAVVGTERLALASHTRVVTGDDARVRQVIDDGLKAAGVQPPDVAALALLAKASPSVVQKALHALQSAGRVQRLDVLWFHADTLTALKAEVKGLGSGATIDVASAKARFGVSRKFAIPLLEYLDRERVTRRAGDKRLVI
ncbi:MAG: selenocysteine-specific translation elongation factor [Acidobacteria bacterium]|jgi:selenocysteine-specific elongation factor|nr:selenocysteine-specific translation elongation factor [Acidobacteriota bacterium]